MLESMTTVCIPTCADVVMLSGETAIGHDPVGAVEMMNRIIKRTEMTLPLENPLEITTPQRKIVEIIGSLVYRAVTFIPEKVNGIITATRSGYTVLWISKFRPPAHIYTVTKCNRSVLRIQHYESRG